MRKGENKVIETLIKILLKCLSAMTEEGNERKANDFMMKLCKFLMDFLCFSLSDLVLYKVQVIIYFDNEKFSWRQKWKLYAKWDVNSYNFNTASHYNPSKQKSWLNIGAVL